MDINNCPAVFTEQDDASAAQISERQAELNVASLYRVIGNTHGQSESSGLLFNLFDSVGVYLETRHIEPGSNGAWRWSGRSLGVPGIYGQLSIIGLLREDSDQLIVSGSVVVLGVTYAIDPIGYNQVRIFLSNPLPYAGSCVHSAATVIAQIEQAQTERHKRDLKEATSQEPATIHILAAYPSAAAASRFEADVIKAKIGHAQTLTNQVFANSRINARVDITLREAYELQHIDVRALLDEVVGENHYQVTAGSKQIHALREEYGADVVALLAVKMTASIDGLSSVIPQPPSYAHTDLTYATFAVALNYPSDISGDPIAHNVFAHELGHLLGARHDRFQEESESHSYDPQFDYVRGYSTDDRSFVTIMGYADRAVHGVRIPFYSSSDPELRYDGKPIGIAPGEPNAADASSFFQHSTQVVARYRGGDVAGEAMHLTTAVEPPLGGSIILSAFGPYPKGAQVMAHAVPRAGGYVFKEWVLDGNALDAHDIEVIMHKNRTLVARFEQGQAIQHTIHATVIPPEAGTIILDPTTYPAGADARVAVQRAPDSIQRYRFLGWAIDGSRALNSKFASMEVPYIHLNVASDHQVEALFGKRVEVIAAGVPANFATVDISDIDIYRYGTAKGQAVQFKPDPYGEKPKAFHHWQVDGVCVEGNGSGDLNLVVTADTLVEACYEGWDNVLTVTTSISPAGLALLNIKPLDTEDNDPAPGYKFVPDTMLIASLFWWNDADEDQYEINWKITEGGHTRTYTSAEFSFRLKQDAKVEAWLTQKSLW